jgi:hypothetical protein
VTTAETPSGAFVHGIHFSSKPVLATVEAGNERGLLSAWQQQERTASVARQQQCFESAHAEPAPAESIRTA